MDFKIKNLDQKREHDEEDGETNTHNENETSEEVDGPTKITDIIDDCLEQIFKYLMLQDLINLADACKRFETPVELTFASMYKGKVVKLYPNRCSNGLEPIKLVADTIQIIGLSSCLKVLRYFGNQIAKLSIQFYCLCKDQKATIAQYMNEHCAGSLNHIKIHGATEQVMVNWTKPFSNAESIELWVSDLGDLNMWFPNMRRLVLHGKVKCIKNTFPRLEELEIFTYEYEIKKESVAEMLRLNPHLKKLRLFGGGYDKKYMKRVDIYFQSLSILHICCDEKFFNLNGSPIHLKSVTEFHIDLGQIYPMPEIPFSFSQLENFQLTMEHFGMNHKFVKFIKQNPSLTKLTIYTALDPLLIKEIKLKINQVSSSLAVDLIKIEK